MDRHTWAWLLSPCEKRVATCAPTLYIRGYTYTKGGKGGGGREGERVRGVERIVGLRDRVGPHTNDTRQTWMNSVASSAKRTTRHTRPTVPRASIGVLNQSNTERKEEAFRYLLERKKERKKERHLNKQNRWQTSKHSRLGGCSEWATGGAPYIWENFYWALGWNIWISSYTFRPSPFHISHVQFTGAASDYRVAITHRIP